MTKLIPMQYRVVLLLPQGVVPIATVIPVQAILCIFLRLFSVFVCNVLFHQTDEIFMMIGPNIAVYIHLAIFGFIRHCWLRLAVLLVAFLSLYKISVQIFLTPHLLWIPLVPGFSPTLTLDFGAFVGYGCQWTSFSSNPGILSI